MLPSFYAASWGVWSASCTLPMLPCWHIVPLGTRILSLQLPVSPLFPELFHQSMPCQADLQPVAQEEVLDAIWPPHTAMDLDAMLPATPFAAAMVGSGPGSKLHFMGAHQQSKAMSLCLHATCAGASGGRLCHWLVAQGPV